MKTEFTWADREWLIRRNNDLVSAVSVSQRPCLYPVLNAAEQVGDVGHTSTTDPKMAALMRTDQREGASRSECSVLLIRLDLHAPPGPLPKFSRLRLIGNCGGG